MTVFNHYAAYYDLLYRDKDYVGEAAFVAALLKKHAPAARRILELGCGTGRHAILLAERGYEVCGIDQSPGMLSSAGQRLAALPPDIATRLQFREGDLRSVRVPEKFDAVISLFHVISYQTSNDDLDAAFATARAHLAPGGVFLFDVWYGPAVLTDRPAVRVKRLEDERIRVTRIAEPTLHPNQNRVDVHYDIQVEDRATGRVEVRRELHPMRYFFKPELDDRLMAHGFTPRAMAEWMTDREPGWDTWGTYLVGQC